ncbi:hypothetical protein DP939_42075 [Spongiactinospora rosea]|uniref:Transposase IS4-like domain-containing protein n=1 Tax=Spongiactinospora rosea TaxID=2248750 RepID=A0A366LKF3_9ACTN|nr:hypothetical protein DP939_42075 [Spongiactinospora rosea]
MLSAYLTTPIRHVFANQGFAGRLVDWARDRLRTTLEIVRKPADRPGFNVIARRWVVERTLAWLTACRRLARDYAGGRAGLLQAWGAVPVDLSAVRRSPPRRTQELRLGLLPRPDRRRPSAARWSDRAGVGQREHPSGRRDAPLRRRAGLADDLPASFVGARSQPGRGDLVDTAAYHPGQPRPRRPAGVDRRRAARPTTASILARRAERLPHRHWTRPCIEPRHTATAYVRGLLADLARKNCWNLAEHAGLTSPQAMQRLLRTARWDTGRRTR